MNYHKGLGLRSPSGHHVGAVETEIVHRCSRCPAVITDPRKTTKYPLCKDCYAVSRLDGLIARFAREGLDLLALDDVMFDRIVTDRAFQDQTRRALRDGVIDQFLAEEGEHALAA